MAVIACGNAESLGSRQAGEDGGGQPSEVGARVLDCLGHEVAVGTEHPEQQVTGSHAAVVQLLGGAQRQLKRSLRVVS